MAAKFYDFGVRDLPVTKKLTEMMGMPMDDPYAILADGYEFVNPYNERMRLEVEYYENSGGDKFDEGDLYDWMPYLDLPPIFIDVAAEIIRVWEERVLARGKDESVFRGGRYDKTKDRARAVARWGEDWKLGDPVPDCVKNGVPYN